MQSTDAAANGPHRVVRQDDNGNRFLVARGLDRAGAEALAAEFEARGHKQLYWVEAEDADGGGAPPGTPAAG
ncbi:SPOR domain-containing protein [Kitasatospora sp. NPDC088391]|uniref:SPOR domain-containing protein n=1 Tax=Kitasatospora sp. NPDC088391 TaxID=3364074 RepID=UPI0037F19982